MKEFRTIDGKKIWRVSRWISVRGSYITERHPLWYYAEIEEDDPKHGWVAWFWWNGCKWAIDQFCAFGSIVVPEKPPQFYEKKNLVTVHAVDMNNIFHPIMLEMDEIGERVRVYLEG